LRPSRFFIAQRPLIILLDRFLGIHLPSQRFHQAFAKPVIFGTRPKAVQVGQETLLDRDGRTHFSALNDPRQSAKVLYPLPEILLLLLSATIAGADDFVGSRSGARSISTSCGGTSRSARAYPAMMCYATVVFREDLARL
jgi:DDE_Tnp_1-associated